MVLHVFTLRVISFDSFFHLMLDAFVLCLGRGTSRPGLVVKQALSDLRKETLESGCPLKLKSASSTEVPAFAKNLNAYTNAYATNLPLAPMVPGGWLYRGLKLVRLRELAHGQLLGSWWCHRCRRRVAVAALFAPRLSHLEVW